MTAGPRIGVLGGSFDPPHFGHLFGALFALETGAVDRVFAIPAAQHAFGKLFAAAFDHRLAMARLLFLRLREVEVSRLEADRPGVSYTIDTLRELRRDHPSATFRLLLGSDTLRDLPKWRESRAVAEAAPPLELPRIEPGRPVEDTWGALPVLSSTAIRDLLRVGDSVALARVLPSSIIQYIEHHGLYR
ncbi:MAG: nicotinate-nicotinamide nucleotide adenylyltransferase [Candidatus Sumerlaeia bacterium]|nr:nicotinate-nicotinamide nucleotide adenylyltransferase [Candidatus Sumerlaeia bacterium]